jgi:hypothetical protein
MHRAELIADIERRLEPSDATLLEDAALRAALLQRDRDALRARLEDIARTHSLPAEQLQLRLTLALVAETTARYGLDEGTVDPERARAAGREFLEDMAFKCVALDAVSRASLIEQSAGGARLVH